MERWTAELSALLKGRAKDAPHSIIFLIFLAILSETKMTNVSGKLRHRRRVGRVSTSTRNAAICLLATAWIRVAPALTSAENVNVTAPAANNVNTSEPTDKPDEYELPTRIGIRERDDDRETDVDPVEMEGMTAALAKQFAEKLVHKMNEEESIYRAHESSSSSSGSSVGAMHYLLTVLQTCFLSFGCALPRVVRSGRFTAFAFTLGMFASLLQAKAFHHPAASSSQPIGLARQAFLGAIGPHNDGTCLTEPGGDITMAHTQDSSRRSVMSAVIATAFGTLCASQEPEAANAGTGTASGGSDELYLAQPLGPPGTDGKLSRPSAPLKYLVPAARVSLYIYKTLSVAEEITKLQQKSDGSEDDSAKLQDLWEKLDALILSPPSFIKSTDPNVSRNDGYGGAPPIIGEIGVAAQKRRERREQSIEADLASELFEPGQLIGERRQWEQLQKAEMKREAASEVRRALNIYTTNLNFNRNKYSFKGSAEEKSALIRNDRLPTATDVIRSDLDSRDLFRNQMQTSLEDSKAEYIYIKKDCGGDVSKADLTELIALLSAAKTAIDKWFAFISDDDVKEALSVVQKEMKA